MKRQRFHCSKCGVKFEEPRSAAYCPPCWNAYYRERNADPAAAQARREATARWRAKDPERARALERARDTAERRAAGVPEKPGYTPEETKAARKASKEKYRAKPEKRAAELAQARVARRALRVAEPAKLRALDRARYVRERESRITQSLKMRVKRAGAPGSHTVAEWKSVLRHYGRRCVYCNVKLTPKNVSRDHKQPLSRQGTNDIRNIVPACRSCNSRKHDRTFEEFAKLLQ